MIKQRFKEDQPDESDDIDGVPVAGQSRGVAASSESTARSVAAPAPDGRSQMDYTDLLDD